MRLLPLAIAALLPLPFATIATAQGVPSPAPEVPAPSAAVPVPPKAAALSADMEAMLRKAGFTDLRILPNSVFVRGKDKAGHPVAMVLDPASMTEMVTLDPNSGSAAGGDGAATLTGSATFATVLPSEKLASKLIGTQVTDKQGTSLGTIHDIAVDHGGVHAYIVQVAGLLGIGERYAAVTPGALALIFDQGSKRYRATMDATPEQMKAAPEFKYGDLDEAAK